MKITHNKVGQNLNLTDSTKAGTAGSAKAAGDLGKADKIDLFDRASKATDVQVSSRAQDMKRMHDLASAAPDVNSEKVSRIQKLIDEGKYNVSGKDIADKMVDEELSYT